MADFSSSAFGGTGPDPAISPSIGGIAKNLTSTLFGNPDDYAKNAYYGAETRKTNQQTQDMVDASTAAKGLADTFSNPDFFSKPPPGVDPGQWVAQHLSAAAKNAFLSAYAKDPGAAMQNVQRLASMTSIMTGDQGMGLTGLAIEGHAPTDQTALTPDAQAQIYGRTAKAALDRANVAAGAEIAANKYRTDNSAVTAGPGGTVFLGPNSGLRTPQNAGILHGADTPDTVGGAALAREPQATQVASVFKPHNITQDSTALIAPGTPGYPQGGQLAGPRSERGAFGDWLQQHPDLIQSWGFKPEVVPQGSSATYAPGDPRTSPDATTVIPAPKTALTKMPKLGGADNIELQSDIVHSFDPGDNSGLGKEAQAAKYGAVTSNLTPDELAEMNDAIAKEYAASNNLGAAGAAGAAYLKSKLQIASPLQRVIPGSSRYSRIAAAPAAQQPAATQQPVGGAGETRVDGQGVIWQRGADGKVHAIGKQG